MNETQLDHGTPDWQLPIKHEEFYWTQFARPGRTFIDIGAHVGTWSLNLAKHFERVFAFEPDPRGWETLKKNLELNGITNVEVIPKAVSNVTGWTTLNLFHNPCTNTMLDPRACGREDSPIGQHRVETVAIDDFVRERGITDLDFLKCDAEAAEMLIVEGALMTLNTQRPDFFIEMHGLFYHRLRAMMPGIECDVVDGGSRGLSLVRHRQEWPGFAPPQYRVYPHPTSPSIEDQRELRSQQGIVWDPPTGFLAEDFGK